MKTLYFDCCMGAAGDMLTAALLELLPDPEKFMEEINSLGIPGVRVEREKAVKCGITGTHISVTVNGVEEESCDHTHEHSHSQGEGRGHEHSHSQGEGHGHEHGHGHGEGHHQHSTLQTLEHIVKQHMHLPEKTAEEVLAVYGLIAEAESKAHGVTVEQVHFHEVGTMDALADITAVCLLMEKLAPEEVVVSPIHVGSGQVRCAHGLLPVPAPATAHILKGVPIYGGTIEGELCTPTGAALLKHFATRFGSMPVMKTEAVGYGMGKKDFEAANCVRAMIGQTEEEKDSVVELICNVDDMTAEAMGFAMDRFYEGGALEVYTIPVGMKKSRPGTLLSVMCRERDREKLLSLMFKHTTTIGVRENMSRRYVLKRRIVECETPYGIVHRKDSSGYGVSRSKYEYDDIAGIAKEKGIGLDQVIGQIEVSARRTGAF